jgi:HD-like signal output (HDOD) protein
MACIPDPDRIRRKIFQIDHLAAVPDVAWRLLDALGDDRTTPGQLERIIESDPGLAGKVLSLANSAYYGLRSKVTTVGRAILMIGARELQMLALGAGLADVFDWRRTPPGWDGPMLWGHSLAVAYMARELADEAGHPQPAEVMTSGLLHDLGKLVLATSLVDEIPPLIARLAEGIPYFKAEEELGLVHTTMGRWLAKRWELPDPHLAVIEHHHDPERAQAHSASVALVCLADRMAKDLGVGPAHEARPLDMDRVTAMAGLGPGRLRRVVERTAERVPVLLASWGYPGGGGRP